MVKKLSDLEGEISVILAGYEDDMNTFLETNEGLKRRFPNEIYLRDYLPNELKEIFLRLVKKENVVLIGFGTFTTSKGAAREGVNPSNGSKIQIPATTVAKFKVGAKLKEAVK